MDLARGDHGGDAAMEETVDPVELGLARRPVAEDGMDVAIDQAWRECGTFGVDLGYGACGVEVLGLADRANLAVVGDNRIDIQDRSVEIAGEQQTDIPDDQSASISAGTLCFNHDRYPLNFIAFNLAWPTLGRQSICADQNAGQAGARLTLSTSCAPREAMK